MGAGPEASLFARYRARIRPELTLVEVPERRGSPSEQRVREGAALLAALPPRAIAVALDLGGPMPDTARFATLLAGWPAAPLSFLIGGAEGLDAAVLSRADHVLSLGPMTWPHKLARIMLAEQIFRAQSIAAGHPYHRADRPETRDRNR